ncbi:hypothetical protein BD626DRAFT_493267 [Schizophyllum amplum]|uniref:Uncharacterized protein n=1 Tax=Schizophyllum amplum TaxID=97359 RepID=A0A550CGM9_9AGAR|nr:hypothetical protein BD626DRAFT_493267 [Auriculariopsis ampla]
MLIAPPSDPVSRKAPSDRLTEVRTSVQVEFKAIPPAGIIPLFAADYSHTYSARAYVRTRSQCRTCSC